MFYVAGLQTTSAAADAELADAAGYLLRDLAWERPMLVSVLGGKDELADAAGYLMRDLAWERPMLVSVLGGKEGFWLLCSSNLYIIFVRLFQLLFLGCCIFPSRVRII